MVSVGISPQAAQLSSPLAITRMALHFLPIQETSPTVRVNKEQSHLRTVPTINMNNRSVVGASPNNPVINNTVVERGGWPLSLRTGQDCGWILLKLQLRRGSVLGQWAVSVSHPSVPAELSQNGITSTLTIDLKRGLGAWIIQPQHRSPPVCLPALLIPMIQKMWKSTVSRSVCPSHCRLLSLINSRLTDDPYRLKGLKIFDR